jgi:hypothetical protein
LAGDPRPRQAWAPLAGAGARLGRLRRRVRFDSPVARAALAPVIAAVATLALVIPTLAPTVLDWDTAEFQTVGPVLGTAHPTGYPAYVILGFVASHVLPFGDPAYRMNLLQAILAAGAVAGTVAIIQYLTGMRWIALATGLLFLTMPTASRASVNLPVSSVGTGPTLWSISTHADPHLFHLALTALLFLTLLIWDRRRHSPDENVRRRADRWLVVSAFVYGVAVANHSLALLLPPAIGLFVLAAAPRILLQWRLVLACGLVLAATIAGLFLELPIRAAMHAPLVYGHPDTLSGFQYVVLAEQFRGSLVDPLGDLGAKFALLMSAFAAWLGPLSYLALAGLASSLVHRPRYVLLSGLAAAATCIFSASYANADISRYFLVPLFVAYTFVGLGLADIVALVAWALAYVTGGVGAAEASIRGAEGSPDAEGSAPDSRPAGAEPSAPRLRSRWRWLPRAIELAVAVAVLAAGLSIVPERESVPSDVHPGGVSLSNATSRRQWMESVLAPTLTGGLPEGSVIVSWWSDSTTLWYGQRVEGLRPDILIIDDSDRVNDNLGEVWDVIDRYLGTRPVFLDRLSGGGDGMDALSQMYVLGNYQLPDGNVIAQVMSKRETQ